MYNVGYLLEKVARETTKSTREALFLALAYHGLGIGRTPMFTPNPHPIKHVFLWVPFLTCPKPKKGIKT